MESDELHAKFVGHSIEGYHDGKLIDGHIVLSWTGGDASNSITTFHLMGTVSNHSANGEGARYEDNFIGKEHRSETGRFKWTLTKQP